MIQVHSCLLLASKVCAQIQTSQTKRFASSIRRAGEMRMHNLGSPIRPTPSDSRVVFSAPTDEDGTHSIIVQRAGSHHIELLQ